MRVKNQLTVAILEKVDILILETKLVIPRSLQRKLIQIAHEGHQGFVQTKQLLREKVYSSNIDKLVEETCQSCIICLAASEKNVPEPLKMSKMPENAFDEVLLDFCGPFPAEKYLLVLIDEHSRFPIVEILSSINAKTVIPVLDKIFLEYGKPKTLKSDNGIPMNSHAFAQFAEYSGLHHRKITPRYPQANAICERFMRSIGKAIRLTNTQHRCWRQDMYAFLRNYPGTPHATTNQSPAEFLWESGKYQNNQNTHLTCKV